jgi:UDP-GlcNAc:undecaprenyl-phosphate/decaprenyl-phosphate GlcNAc-1-phosphate transferase
MSLLILTFTIALVSSWLLTRWIREYAQLIDFVDRPDGKRKIQSQPVSLGGGLAIYLSAVISLAVVAATRPYWDWLAIREMFAPGANHAFGLNVFQIVLLFVSGGILCLVGLYDDRFHIRGRTKLVWQIAACAILVYYPNQAGIVINRLTIFGTPYELGNVGPLLTMAWLILSINSFNLIDGVDGLAGSLGIVFSAAFGIMALWMGNLIDGLVAFIMVGSLIGFLRYNFNPASIYMGDAGSMLIGLVLGTLAIRSSIKEQALSVYAAPLAVWAIPFLDSTMAILRRKLTGRSIYATDRGHIHHRLLTSGLTPRQAVGLLAGLSAITALSAVLSLIFDEEWIGVVGVVIVFGILLATRLFGNVELSLLNSKLLGFTRTVLGWNDPSIRNQISHQLQGKLQWEEKMWSALVESADRFGLINIKLNLYLPHLHEDFHATWSSPSNTEHLQKWRMDLPLVAGDMIVGSLAVVGIQPSNSSASNRLTEFLDFLEPVEAQLAQILALPAPIPNTTRVPTNAASAVTTEIVPSQLIQSS